METQTLSLLLVFGGVLVILITLFSDTIKTEAIASQPLVALVAGVIVGPAGLNWLDPTAWTEDWPTFLETLTRILLALELTALALNLPSHYLRQHWGALAVVLGIVMPAMWLISTVTAVAVLGIPLALALVIGGVVTPTDPIIATSIVSGQFATKMLPARLRNLLSSESGINDGLAYPFVWLALLLVSHPPGEAWTTWATQIVLVEVGGGILVGLGLGYVAAKLLKLRLATIDHDEWLAFTPALALAVLSLANLLHLNDLIAVFAAAYTYRESLGDENTIQEQLHTQKALNYLYRLPFLAIFGMVLPWQAWGDLGWQAVALVLLILLLRRLPIVLLVSRWIAELPHRADALFLGWFGPIGVGSIFYALLAWHETGDALVWNVGTLVIAASILAHGLTATHATRWYARATGDKPEP